MALRATCERCGGAQPFDWKSGDLCVHCSGQVRREQRCFWCNHWGPAGGFCRDCGAEQVAAEHYGAARMLTRSGSDMFSVPRLVREMEPARLAVFADKYARQRAAVARHVDDLAFVESFCKHRGFAAALEEELLASLPWADDAEYAPVDVPASARLTALAVTSPISLTRDLATVVRLWWEQWDALREVDRLARGEGMIADEAVLAVTWWRTLLACNRSSRFSPRDALERMDLREHAAVRLAAAGIEVDPALIAAARASTDADLAFAAALVQPDVPALRAALDEDPLMQRAAAIALAENGALEALEPWLRGASAQAAKDPVRALSRKDDGRALALAPRLLELMEVGDDDFVSNVGTLLARHTTVDVAMRVAALCRGAIYVVQALMDERTGLSPVDLGRVGQELVRRGYLTMNKYGVSEAAKRGAFPDDFVIAAFALADDAQKKELCRFAENQLEGKAIPVVHAFLLRTVFGPYHAEVRAAAWWALSRGYHRAEYGSFGPLELTPASIGEYFASVPEFLDGFTAVLEDFPTLKEVGVFDFLNHLVRGLDAERAAALRDFAPCARWVAAMRAAAQLDIWSPLRESLTHAAALF